VAAEWTWQSLGGGWGVLKRDPIGILLPASGALLVHVAGVMAVRAAWYEPPAVGAAGYALSDWGALAALAAGVQLARILLGSAFRAPMIAAGARALDRPASGLRGALPLVAVDLVVGGLELLAAAIVGVPLGGLAFLALTRGLALLAALAAAAGLVGAATIALVVRASFAYAAAEAVIDRHPPWKALGNAWTRARGDRVQLMVLLVTGDALLGVGGALCGAGALPGYPIADLAVLHRWTRREAEAA
jgi:hypothetical protein